MATTKEEPMAAPQAAQEPQQKSARDRYRERYGAAHPDMNLDDEEAFYTQANQNLDELENFRESNRQLGEAIDKTPLLAGLLVAAKEGENPFTFLAENIGPDMDIRELANDPEFGEKMGQALTKFQEGITKNEEMRKEIGENFQKSVVALKELAAERGMSDEERNALFKKMYGEVYEEGNQVDPGIFGNASVGIVPKEVWEAVLKAQNYDGDIASATEKARATALNERLQNEKRSFGAGVPTLSGGGAGKTEQPKKKGGSFADFGTE